MPGICISSSKTHWSLLAAHPPHFAQPRCPFALSETGGIYDLGFSFFSFHSALRPTPETLTTLKRTPGISPLALPFRPKPANSTSSFSSTKFKQPSLGTVSESALLCIVFHLYLHSPKAVTFFPFLINCTRTHFRMAEFGCLASTPTFSRTMPFAWEEPPNGEDL